jgi:hypothetical protein
MPLIAASISCVPQVRIFRSKRGRKLINAHLLEPVCFVKAKVKCPTYRKNYDDEIRALLQRTLHLTFGSLEPARQKAVKPFSRKSTENIAHVATNRKSLEQCVPRWD